MVPDSWGEAAVDPVVDPVVEAGDAPVTKRCRLRCPADAPTLEAVCVAGPHSTSGLMCFIGLVPWSSRSRLANMPEVTVDMEGLELCSFVAIDIEGANCTGGG